MLCRARRYCLEKRSDTLWGEHSQSAVAKTHRTYQSVSVAKEVSCRDRNGMAQKYTGTSAASRVPRRVDRVGVGVSHNAICVLSAASRATAPLSAGAMVMDIPLCLPTHSIREFLQIMCASWVRAHRSVSRNSSQGRVLVLVSVADGGGRRAGLGYALSFAVGSLTPRKGIYCAYTPAPPHPCTCRGFRHEGENSPTPASTCVK